MKKKNCHPQNCDVYCMHMEKNCQLRCYGKKRKRVQRKKLFMHNRLRKKNKFTMKCKYWQSIFYYFAICHITDWLTRSVLHRHSFSKFVVVGIAVTSSHVLGIYSLSLLYEMEYMLGIVDDNKNLYSSEFKKAENFFADNGRCLWWGFKGFDVAGTHICDNLLNALMEWN